MQLVYSLAMAHRLLHEIGNIRNLLRVFVTGSAKTRHNRASLNLQYKALITMREILAYYFKIHKYLSDSFLVEEGTNNKNLDIILFTCSRGVGKYLFCCSKPKDTQALVYVTSKRSYTIDFSSPISPLYAVQKDE